MNASKTIVRMLAAASATFGLTASAFAQATFQGLGDLPGGAVISLADDVSADGAVVVGNSDSAASSGRHEAFRWTAAGGMVGLGDLPGGRFASRATATSADGRVVVGIGDSAFAPADAFRWTSAGGMVALGFQPAGARIGSVVSVASATSANGAVVVGGGGYRDDITSILQFEALRWTVGGGAGGLGHLPGGGFGSLANAVSADGAVIVGYSDSASSLQEAFRWTSASGMVGLGHLPGGGSRSSPSAVSADGAVIVGTSDSASSFQEAFRWTSASGMVGLGDLPGGIFRSVAIATSADGSVILGGSTSASGFELFLWTAENGMRSLTDLLVTDFGLDLTGWQLGFARDMSADGLTIVGNGINPDGFREAWIATIFNDCNSNGIPDETEADTDGDGLIDDCDPDADPDNDGILSEVDLEPFVPSTAFSDVLLGGVTAGTVSDFPIVLGLEIRDAPDPADGIQVEGELGCDAEMALTFACLPPTTLGACDTSAPGPFVANYTCISSLRMDVVSGAGTFGFTIDGTPHSVDVSEGGSVILRDTLDEFGDLEVMTVIAAGARDTVSVDGQPSSGGSSFLPADAPDLVGIDIKPNASPNTINLGSNGSVSVAIFSTATFDATTIDPVTVMLAGAAVNLRGNGTPQTSLRDVNGDGLTDLLVHMDTQAFELSENDTLAFLMASADCDGDGVCETIVSGQDTIRVVP